MLSKRRGGCSQQPPLLFSLSAANNGLPVCAMRERVNRYTVKYWFMLTASATYGKMFLNRKGCVRRRRL